MRSDDLGAPTQRQLETLLALAETGRLDAAADRLGAKTEQQVTKSLKRLSDQLGAERDLFVQGSGSTLVPVHEDLPRLADEILALYRRFQEKARDSRQYWIRVDGFSSHLSLFLAEAIGQFLRSNDSFRVDLSAGFGSTRPEGGQGVLHQLRDEAAELVVAPRIPRNHDSSSLSSEARHLYDAVLVAAIASGPSRDGRHSLFDRLDEKYAGDPKARARYRHRTKSGVLWVGDLDRQPLATSPDHHLTRLMLRNISSSDRAMIIDLTNPEPHALVAFGRQTNLVPLIASDSSVEWNDTWPVIVDDDDDDVRWSYDLHTRTTGLPRDVVAGVSRLAETVAETAARNTRSSLLSRSTDLGG